MKRFTLPLLAVFTTTTSPAQNLQELMNKAMQQQGGQPASETQVTIEENQDPFVPLTFTGGYRMEIHSFKNGKEEKDSPVNMRMAFRPDGMAMVPDADQQEGSMRMVFDLKNKHTYTLMTDETGERTGMKMKMMKVNVEGEPDAGKDDVKVIRTDETKVIDGHTCRKYTYSDKEGSGEAWIAEDIKMDMMAPFKQMMGGKKPENWQKAMLDGVIMENTWTSTDGKEKVVMHTKDLVIGKVDEALFSTAGYEIQDMTNFPMFGQ